MNVKVLKLKNTFHVSHAADELVQDLEQAYMRLHVASGPAEIDNAYAALSQRKRDLYEHLEDLEGIAERVRPVVKRF